MKSANTRSASESVDLLIVGAGIAGLFAALTSVESGAKVLVVSKGSLTSSASYHAQGGIAASGADGDSAELHIADTLAAGRGLCRPSAVQVLVEEAPARIDDLRAFGVDFEPELGLEGGHSRPRIYHVGGAVTGREIELALAERVREHPEIQVSEGERVLGIWRSHQRCTGVVTETRSIAARATLLATGGAAALWARTTNPSGALGEGIAMAYRVGAAVADLEFVQFHPTALPVTGALLSEALRGAGALLLDEHGERFTDELAPRDVVARAIDSHGGTALLDLRPIDRSRFPSLMTRIREAGYDPDREPVPVAPAAHYTLGGIITDLDGRSELGGLYAAGECACTGVHGANRLASNSLLECAVFGRRAALSALSEPPIDEDLEPPAEVQPDETIDKALREEMWREAGLVRDEAGLERLLSSTRALLPQLVASCALARRESRGVHFRVDFPAEDAQFAAHTVIRPGSSPVFEQWI